MQSGCTMRMEFDNDDNVDLVPSVHVQCVDSSQPVDDRALNFATTPDEIDQTFMKKPKIIRDPLSHRIIEKRRRDRMNNCLADLSRLLPINYLKQMLQQVKLVSSHPGDYCHGQGRIEKTEIIEMAIKHIHNVTSIANKQGLKSSLPDRYLGFKECQDEVMRYLVEIEGWEANNKLCNRLMAHLEQAGEKFRIMNDETLTQGAREEQYRHADEHSQSIELGTLEYSNENAKIPGIQYPTQQQPNPMVMQVDTNQTTNLSQQTSFPGYETFADAQQITQEHLQRDKHLWTLLTSKYNPTRTSKDSGISTETGSSSSMGTSQVKYGVQDDRLYRTDNLNLSYGSASMDTCSDKSDSNVYKFKDNITKRFSQEKKTSSVTGDIRKRVEKSVDKPKRKFRPIRSPSPSSSGSSRCRNSDGSNVASSSLGDTGNYGNEDMKPSQVLPGFVLHPSGTHYIPLTIHRSNMDQNIFAQLAQQGQCVFHPISIPVNFGGTHLYIKKVSLRSNGSQSMEQSSLTSGSPSGSSGSPSGCGSVGNSSCSPPMDSTSSEQDSVKT